MSESNCYDCSIQTSCLLGQLDPGERAVLLPLTRQRVLHRGESLVEEAQVSSVLRILKLGTVFVYRRGLDGRSRPIAIQPRGAALGAFGILGKPSQATGVAMATIRVCDIPIDALRDMFSCGSKLMTQMVGSVVQNVAAMAAWSEAMRLTSVLNRLAYVLLLLADGGRSSVLDLPSQTDLAELLGTRRESIARALRGLEDDGDIELSGRRRCVVVRSKLLARLEQSMP
ncbi:MAG: Crp/Fnr family transcriptional regulator [Paucibacter sp.]|nr:Crp/Fnr family transcriptional regulator [Roseateles sp.]